MRTSLITYIFGLLVIMAVVVEGITIPLDHPVYESVDYLSNSGFLPGLQRQVKPYDLRVVNDELKRINPTNFSPVQFLYYQDAMAYLDKASKGSQENNLLLDAHLKAVASSADTFSYHSRLHVGAAYTYKRFSLVNRVAVDATNEKDRYDHLERKYNKKMAADMPQAYLQYHGDKWGLLAGRNQVKWGPGMSGNLMLGDHMPPLNQVLLWGNFGFLKGYTLSSRLTPTDSVTSRYFSASRLVISLKKNLYIALNQSVVYAGAGRNFEMHYVIPSFIYYFGTFGFALKNKTENLLVGADGEWNIRNKYRLYFEFLADDFQVDRDTRSRTTQNAIAWLVGLDCPNLYKGMDAGFEYYRANSYVYKNSGGFPVYYIANLHGGVIGHEIGPDAEALQVNIAKRWKRHLNSGLRYSLVRRGDLNSVYGIWDAHGKADEAIPHGVVCSEHTLVGEAGFIHFNGFSISGNVGYHWFVNKSNVLDNDNSGVVWQVGLQYYFDRLLQWNTRSTLFALTSPRR
ncbi:MAG: hypothetical protein A2268_13190 [Candidatus Raymondbacteria bacterium RifOxyA12_full_50_37]|uniref:Alginate export domain-containing protein n=1 Tax=Candidatus Raymondbacteria bacterium RIFOXYD12_FULL_49_13 TaxID=1817890 RepID=A0A1F7EZV5_UNCRA|nr:MAG: hypothetical protein A2268_13190 [Candidatus Raymondbacteria bacterium RifOxyA12_full_50_37]OGJ93016.1 MAG: hypothetical protein A2248_18325 [Candidatus Raymondbacteria bacterium RIFOXYA2_FULL_49_16]OGJ93592.1 MAG: hypothetical protein A2350_19100 [Candidatus Raymondbacteria bacterium RifOxyB12_full_50_8]OGJ99929.1 MAG: hypothetical protein A2519_00305 [Candidatus Raymondbacteria bacterium RIFOXYD12_FULL_49_13]OGK01561.1 MAG: hypothetical protein A2487_15575 [Candidatus Raymondbacteria 